MIKRIIDISSKCYLSLKQGQVIIKKDEEVVGRTPIEDIGILILEHPAIVITQKLVIACQKMNTTIVFCDERRLPYSLTLPISEANTLHHKILKTQIDAKKSIKNNLWKQIVSEKIRNQSLTLKVAEKDHSHLYKLSQRVKSGDRDNLESQAAQKYWKLLFGKDFRRDTDANGTNALLNYGYAIIRAMTARAIIGGGLHPALGIHHDNQYNGLCLADDLMEPFRPWVDFLVYRIICINSKATIDRDTKQSLLALPSEAVDYHKKTMPFMVACHYLIADFKRALTGDIGNFEYPKPVSLA